MDRVEDLLELPKPVVLIHPERTATTVPCVWEDNYYVMRQLAKAVHASGYRHVGLIITQSANIAFRQRMRGLRDGLCQFDCFRPEYVSTCAFTVHDGRSASAELLREHPEIEVLVCGGYGLALGAYRGLTDLGLRVGEDVGVISSYDAPSAATLTPPLTAVHLPLEQLAQESVAAIEGLMVHPNRSIQRYVEGHLCVRGSCRIRGDTHEEDAAITREVRLG
jgi:DNA-binding LacI/PurR family transcriptional regulator